ncbi:hypothetical protein C8Q79DRAFT_970269 [Trametes meyenii]|nr:hypothetical protein C8Q79DRAFT_970269 [Trametes meyenii]
MSPRACDFPLPRHCYRSQRIRICITLARLCLSLRIYRGLGMHAMLPIHIRPRS